MSIFGQNKNTQQQNGIATGLAQGPTAKLEHVTEAVQQAMQKAGLSRAASVLLFLSNGYALDPKHALKAAAKQACTLQVYGCSAVGLLNEQHSLLDVEGAVAMVFPNDCSLSPANVLIEQEQLSDEQALLCITSPQSSKIAINHFAHNMLGAISSNEFGQGDFPIWQGSRISKSGFFHAAFNSPLTQHTVVSQGVRRLSKNQRISESNSNCLLSIDHVPAAESIKLALPDNLYDLFVEQPYHTLCAVSENESAEGLNQNFFKLNNVVTVDEQEESIYLSGKVKTNQHLFWAIRDRSLAKEEIRHNMQALKEQVKKPKFAFLFTSISRGPYFFSKEDADLKAFQDYFPNVPLIGIYGTGEISPGAHYNALSRRYASVLTLFE